MALIDPWVLSWSCLSGIVGIVGIGAALWAWWGIAKEREILDNASNKLVPDEAWRSAHTATETELFSWLRENGIEPDSHVGDFVGAAWAGWLGGRATTLAEFHAVANKRERGRGAPRLAAGIATLLLVFGIVGTLFSVKPVLKAFKIHTSENGEVQEAGQSAELVNQLVNDLGDAFWPSLVALGFTILVVGCRGIYALKAHDLSRQLDRFARGTLLSRYKVPTLAEELGGLSNGLSALTKRLLERDSNFSDAVTKLEALVTGIQPAIDMLERSAKNSEKASERLAARSQSIADGLTRTLGSSSPLYKAVTGLGAVFEQTDAAVQSLTGMVEKVGREQDANRTKLDGSVKTVEKFAGELPGKIEASTHEAVTVTLGKVNEQLMHTNGEVAEVRDKAIAAIKAQSSTATEVIVQAIAKGSMTISNHATALNEGLTGHLTALKQTSGQISNVRDEAIKAISTEGTTAASAIKQVANAAIEPISGLKTILTDLRSGQLEHIRDGMDGISSVRDSAITAIAQQGKKAAEELNNAAATASGTITRSKAELDAAIHEHSGQLQKETIEISRARESLVANLRQRSESPWGAKTAPPDPKVPPRMGGSQLVSPPDGLVVPASPPGTAISSSQQPDPQIQVEEEPEPTERDGIWSRLFHRSKPGNKP